MSSDPRHKAYNRWRQMIIRCADPSSKDWPYYGGRGITVCERWRDFDAYLADVGYPPAPGMSIDRIDNEGGYSPDNVRWATRSEQMKNSRPALVVRTNCRHGHPYDDANTYTDSRGRRTCRACNRAAVTRSKARRLARAS